MAIILTIPGATEAEIGCGVDAAISVFAEAEMSPKAAARGAFDREGWDVKGFPEDESPSDAKMDAAAVWDRAENAAFTAAWGDRPLPAGANFEVT